MPAAKKSEKPRQKKMAGDPMEILVTELREIYSAENQLIKASPRFAKARCFRRRLRLRSKHDAG